VTDLGETPEQKKKKEKKAHCQNRVWGRHGFRIAPTGKGGKGHFDRSHLRVMRGSVFNLRRKHKQGFYFLWFFEYLVVGAVERTGAGVRFCVMERVGLARKFDIKTNFEWVRGQRGNNVHGTGNLYREKFGEGKSQVLREVCLVCKYGKTEEKARVDRPLVLERWRWSERGLSEGTKASHQGKTGHHCICKQKNVG